MEEPTRTAVLGASAPRLPRRLDRDEARDALDRIGVLYDVESQIFGRSPDVRRAPRRRISAPKVEAFRSWSEAQLARLPGKGELAKAFRYAL